MAINTYFQNIAAAIREKTSESGLLTPAQMPDAIRSISGGTELTAIEKAILYVYNFPSYAGGYEYAGNIYGNTAMIDALGIELLYDASQGISGTIELLHSIADYEIILLQGIYRQNRTSEYNTTIMYENVQLNTAYWAGMKDRNNSYTSYTTFLDNTHATVGGNNHQVIIYGM